MTHPLKKEAGPLKQVRKILLALPEATEKIAWGEPTWRVKDKLFAQYDNNHHNAGRIGIWFKATPVAQDMYVRMDPERYYVPPYVGHKGWVGVRLDVQGIDWDMFAEIAAEAWRLTAPKKLLAAAVDDAAPSPPARNNARVRRPARSSTRS